MFPKAIPTPEKLGGAPDESWLTAPPFFTRRKLFVSYEMINLSMPDDVTGVVRDASVLPELMTAYVQFVPSLDRDIESDPPDTRLAA